ncbi:FimV/HubP family polar landmark protein [Oceanisphaera pacifica]|uniref:FimV/HubP family polar landmark protein n=1 Tax=Oceanisphaera pacifica TaxID=2818389 RepID=UPI00311CE0DB
MIKRLRPYLGVGLALWLGCAGIAAAQDDFYIELRGPESSDSRRVDSPAQNTTQASGQNTPQTRQPSSTRTPVISPGRYGPIRSTDTLWAIAARNTTAPTTVQQTMVALYHLNSQAFVRGNINHLQRGAQLRLPTQTQATQRTAEEAEREFRQLSRQGARQVSRAATPKPATPKPAAPIAPPAEPSAEPATDEPAQPAEKVTPPAPRPQETTVVEPPKPAAKPVTPSAPMAATPPEVSNQGLSEPKAAPDTPKAPPSTPEQAENAAQNRLQLQLMDELREQVSMSNEQLTELANNNQALRQRLTQLTAEVEALKNTRSTSNSADATVPGSAKESKEGWLSDLLSNPINLALILILPALLLMALFTLWWRKRERKDLAEQEQELSESSAMLEEETNDFDDLFGTEDDVDPMLADMSDELELEPEDESEPGVDEDAFARFLEEQQLQEEQENQPTSGETAPVFADTEKDSADLDLGEDALFDDEALSQDDQGERMSNDDLDDLFGEPQAEQAAESLVSDTNNDDEVNLDDANLDDETSAGALNNNTQDQEDAVVSSATAESSATQASTESLSNEPATDNAERDNDINRNTDTAETLADSLFADGAPAAALDESEALASSVTDTSAVDELLADETNVEDDYVSVDQLMAEAEAADGVTAERERKLDLELDDYADVIGQADDVDIDADEGGIGAQLDLARAYIEIDDIDSARDLLNEALEQGNKAQQRDASKLLQRLDKRG